MALNCHKYAVFWLNWSVFTIPPSLHTVMKLSVERVCATHSLADIVFHTPSAIPHPMAKRKMSAKLGCRGQNCRKRRKNRFTTAAIVVRITRGTYFTIFPYTKLVVALKNPSTIRTKPTLLTPTHSEMKTWGGGERTRRHMGMRLTKYSMYFVCSAWQNLEHEVHTE